MAINLILISQLGFSQSEANSAESGQLKPLLLFVHGLFGNGLKSWGTVIRELPLHTQGYRYGGDLRARGLSRFIDKRADFFTLTFSDPKSLTFTQQGKELGEIVARIHQRSDRPIILIGSSMGGLAIRAFLAEFGTEGIAGVITINTPHVGSILGLLKNYLDGLKPRSHIYSANVVNPIVHDVVWDYVRNLTWRIAGLDLQAPAVQFLNPRSPEMQELAGQGLPKTIPYACFLSDWQDDSSIKAQALNVARDFLRLISSQKKTPYGVATDKVHENWGDGIVSLWSQDIKSIGAGAHGIRLFRRIVEDPKFTFHTDANKNITGILEAVAWITRESRKIGTESQSPVQTDATQIGHSGELKITLQWTDRADLDLHVQDPCGGKVFYKTPNVNCAGNEGSLDVDANAGCNRNMSQEPAENIYWVKTSPGSYKVFVQCYNLCSSSGPVSFTLTVFNKGKRTNSQGYVGQTGQIVEVTTVQVD